MNELFQAWEKYKRRSLPRDAPPVQKIETRRAYYYGCGLVLDLMEKLIDQPEFVRKRELAALVNEHRIFMLEHHRDEPTLN